jgi:histidinol phosphatase-like PHP family hydrolase
MQVEKSLRKLAGDRPILVVPGNHDGSPLSLYKVFSARPGVHKVGGANVLPIGDQWEGEEAFRRQADREAVARAAAADRPLIVCQHSPVHPPIEADYPYMLTNREQAMADYESAGVALSVSGHYHPGQALTEHNGVWYLTVPAICEAPFPYVMATVKGGKVKAAIRTLRRVHPPALTDNHCHTEFSYCGKGVTAAAAIERAKVFGLKRLCLTEHAPQLYCTADEFWNARHLTDPSCWRSAANSRMSEFRRCMQAVRNGLVRIGLEVEQDQDGNLTLHDEDRECCDVLLGAVHWVLDGSEEASDENFVRCFWRDTAGLIEHGVDVLAHPLRAFRARKMTPPKHLMQDLAAMLAESGVAAEINFHGALPFPDFLAECVRAGVQLSFGSDAHIVQEVGNLTAHLALLRALAGRRDVEELMWQPRARAQQDIGQPAK